MGTVPTACARTSLLRRHQEIPCRTAPRARRALIRASREEDIQWTGTGGDLLVLARWNECREATTEPGASTVPSGHLVRCRRWHRRCIRRNVPRRCRLARSTALRCRFHRSTLRFGLREVFLRLQVLASSSHSSTFRVPSQPTPVNVSRETSCPGSIHCPIPTTAEHTHRHIVGGPYPTPSPGSNRSRRVSAPTDTRTDRHPTRRSGGRRSASPGTNPSRTTPGHRTTCTGRTPRGTARGELLRPPGSERSPVGD